MKYFLDTEFIEYPCTIDLISIGIVAEDGREYYAISEEFDHTQASQWVKENVISKLEIYGPWRTREAIKNEIIEFIGDDKNIQFYGWYCSYDWIVFCWLFGNMMTLPNNFPKFIRDIRQMVDEGIIPKNNDNVHNALADARWTKFAYEYLNEQTN